MEGSKKNKFRDSLHEFLIMAILGLGVSIPVIVFNIADILSRVNTDYFLHPSAFAGVY